ncbi:MAG: DUF1836 domain-containing protein [Defluviitaleaceae bacterium]|nr:DUF1836 domain-containing protein [Defluviitaleaceae bacterium]
MDNTDPLHDIHHYSPTFTIAQLLKFSERKHLGVTRPMVQNYIRDGLLPPPAKRLYTHKHLAALVIIAKLKAVYEIPVIKTVLAPYMDGEGLPLDIYTRLMNAVRQADKQWDDYVNLQDNLPLMLHVAKLKTKINA